MSNFVENCLLFVKYVLFILIHYENVVIFIIVPEKV